MKCEVCGIEFPDGINPNGCRPYTMCILCMHLQGLGLPFKYTSASIADYKNGLSKWFESKNSLFIHGGVGTGKTWLMSALMRENIVSSAYHYKGNNFEGEERITYKSDYLFVSFPEIAMRIRASMNARTSETESTIVEKYGTIRNLFLDDIGAEKSSEYMQSILFMLIEMRNTGRNRRTVITSNLSLNMLAQQHGERVASRITEMCEVVKLSGSDRRLK